ncbi:hypothetical protein MRB53_008310 [Persea americana]|uniref:Uncharacterized protein n=1 Tax=Persea americana TaxID=3435 RepID=A0ACC2MN42_PERAE|nr:hypothetical protein MRB53_008310 [Persea americana]
MVQPMDPNLIDPTWYGVILGAIFSILQLIYQGGSVESHFHLLKNTVSLYASISLITLTSCKTLPSPIPFKISLVFAILAVAAPLSAAVPSKLWWVPYLSCIRPLFDLLRHLYLFCTDLPLDPIWEFGQSIRTRAYQFKLRAHQFIQSFRPNNMATTSPAQENSNSAEVMGNALA